MSGKSKTMQQAAVRRKHLGMYWPWLLLLGVLIVTAIIRLRLADMPLERDEGEYAYVGQLLLQGIPPFVKTCNMKMPGIYAAYAAIMAVLGQTIRGIHVGLLLVNAASIVLVFLVGRRLVGAMAGVCAAGAYATLSLSLAVYGPFAHATHFVVLFMMAGILVLLAAARSTRPVHALFAGLLFGAAFMMKQHAAPVIVFAALYLGTCLLNARPRPWRKAMFAVGTFSIGVLSPFLATCVLLWAVGAFEQFWFWTVEYAREYVSMQSLSQGYRGLTNRLGQMAPSAAPLWALAFLGLTSVLWRKDQRKLWFFLFAFLLFSFAAVCPGLYFREHYFITMLPAVALLAGHGAESLSHLLAQKMRDQTAKRLGVGVCLAACAFLVFSERDNLLFRTHEQVLRATYAANPFFVSVPIARYIEEHSLPTDQVAVLGSEPQVYFYTRRISATRYLYMYPLMESHPYATQMQQDMITQIETARPKFIVFTNAVTSWLPGPESDTGIIRWTESYVPAHYRKVAVAEMVATGGSKYYWGREAERHVDSSTWIAAFVRVDDAAQ